MLWPFRHLDRPTHVDVQGGFCRHLQDRQQKSAEQKSKKVPPSAITQAGRRDVAKSGAPSTFRQISDISSMYIPVFRCIQTCASF